MPETKKKTETALEAVLSGRVPEDRAILRELTEGLEPLAGFLRDQYLTTYIPAGGSKIKFITGRPGSGKTHFLHLMREIAREEKYITVSFSAKEVWLHDFREIYLQALRQTDLERLLRGCAEEIIRDLGYDPSAIPEGKTLMDFLSERGEVDPLTKNDIRTALRRRFTRNPRLDSGFAGCCSLLTGSLLGHPVLEKASWDLVMACLNGEKGIKSAQLRLLGLSPMVITKYNARHLLRSLAELTHLAGYQGLLIQIDDMEALLNRTEGNGNKYTRLRREDAYESIRQLIDDIDNMRFVLFMLAFDRELIDNEDYGLKSYQALWLRIQNEVISTRFNGFADMIDLDRYGDTAYMPEALNRMAEKLEHYLRREGAACYPMSEETLAQLISRAEYGGLGLPFLVNRTIVEGATEHV